MDVAPKCGETSFFLSPLYLHGLGQSYMAFISEHFLGKPPNYTNIVSPSCDGSWFKSWCNVDDDDVNT